MSIRGGLECYLVCVDASGHGPGGHDVVHHPLAEAFGDLVEFEEVSHTVEHLVVSVGVSVHLLEDGGDVTEDGGVQQRCKQDGENIYSPLKQLEARVNLRSLH